MVTFEQANILATILLFPCSSKETLAERLAGRYGIAVNKAVLSSVVDGLSIAGYLASTKGLPTEYSLNRAGLDALHEFDEMVETYRSVRRSV